MSDITVVIPTRGTRPEWLQEAIDSIERQTLKPKIIVVESNDDVCDKINQGVAQATTKYVLIFCDDDKMPEDFLERLYKYAEKNTLPIVSVFIENFAGDTGRHGPGKHPFFSSLILRSVFLEVGGFDKEMLQMADVDFWTKCFNKGYKWEVCPEAFYHYRVHSTQDSRTADWDKARERYLTKHGKFL